MSGRDREIRMRNRSLGVGLASLAALVLTACIHTDAGLDPDVELGVDPTMAEQSAPLGGEALSQRRLEMRRAHLDLVHFHTTLASLNQRRDRNGQVLFKGFLDAYIGTHVEPMLSGEWQSRHPELAALDANVRLTQAELLIQMREPSRAQQVIEKLAARYAGREEMVVAYPIGDEGTLREALDLLRERKWWRG
jgi:hypothetical protein